ncbi:MAG: response regulator [Planctomycetota bacterium]
MDQPRVTNTLRMNDRELRRILSLINSHDKGETASSKRRTRRWDASYQKVVVSTMDEHARMTHTLAILRNISETGLSYVHGQFMHINRECTIAIRDNQGQPRAVAGKIVRCSHVDGRFHEIGVRFDSPIDPHSFFITNSDDYAFHSEGFELSELKGEVLIVSPIEDEVQYLQSMFLGSFLTFDEADSIESFDKLDAVEYSYVIANWDLPDGTGIELLNAILAKEMIVPTIFLSALLDERRRVEGVSAGAVDVLFMPFEPSLLHRALADELLDDRKERINIQLSGDQLEASRWHIERAMEFSREAVKRLAAQDAAGLSNVLRDLSGISHRLELPTLQMSIERALSCATRGDLGTISSEIRNIVRICRAATSGLDKDAA